VGIPSSTRRHVRFIGLFVCLALILAVLLPALPTQAQTPLTSGFTYQGQLFDDGASVTDTCDFRFLLYDMPVGGTQISSTQTIEGVAVTDGYFDVVLDFGATAFQGDTRYLDIAVRCGDETNFSTFPTRVALNAAPYSLYALGAAWDGLTGVPADLADGDADTDAQTLALVGSTLTISNGNSVNLAPFLDNTDTDAQTLALVGSTLTISNGNSVDLAPFLNDTDTTYTVTAGLTLTDTTLGLDTAFTDARYWQLGGNTGALTPTLGTTDGLSLTLVVSGTPALRLLPVADGPPNIVGGAATNRITNTVVGAFIGGGGTYENDTTVGPNQVLSPFGVIGGGSGNTAGYTPLNGLLYRGWHTFIGGGENNTASGRYNVVSGGSENTASGIWWSTVSGGHRNTASRVGATIGGGEDNTASSNSTTIGGGFGNTASGLGATVGGGSGNTASSSRATVGGGDTNTASGSRATVGGGRSNEASGSRAAVGGGDTNTASGSRATVGGGGGNTASDTYATVGGGSNNTASGSRATVSGGSGNTASGRRATVSGGRNNTASGNYSFAAGRQAIADDEGAFVWADSTSANFSSLTPDEFAGRASGGFRFVIGNVICELKDASGWKCASSSDRNAKTAFQPVDSRDVLERVARLPIASWQYRSEDASVRHIGPMAQDFSAAFGLGSDDTTISTVDADGVTFAAIQGLHEIIEEQESEIAALEQQLDAQQAQLDAIQAQLEAIQE
jgi:hypothetical protein